MVKLSRFAQNVGPFPFMWYDEGDDSKWHSSGQSSPSTTESSERESERMLRRTRGYGSQGGFVEENSTESSDTAYDPEAAYDSDDSD